MWVLDFCALTNLHSFASSRIQVKTKWTLVLILHVFLNLSSFVHAPSYSRCHTRVMAYIDPKSSIANLFPGCCHTIPVLAHLWVLFCGSSSNLFPHPSILRRLSIFIAHLATFPARLLPRGKCLICPFVQFYRIIFTWNSLVRLGVGLFICIFNNGCAICQNCNCVWGIQHHLLL